MQPRTTTIITKTTTTTTGRKIVIFAKWNELRKGIIYALFIYTTCLNLMQVVTNKNKTNKKKTRKKRNKDWYWNVETPKKETKTNFKIFSLVLVQNGIYS